MKVDPFAKRPFRSKARRAESGQAIIEYVLILVVVMAAMGVLGRGLRTTVRSVWVTLAKEIAAPCPKCDPPSSMR